MKESLLASPGRCPEFGGSVWRLGYWFPCVLALVFLFSGIRGFAADPASSGKNVLVLQSFTVRNSLDSLEPLKSTVRSRIAEPVTFHVEYLESERFSDAGYQKGLSDELSHAYGGQKLDLVIVASYPALRFAVDHRGEIFPGVPIVFMSVAPGRIQGQKLWPGVTGVTITVDVRATIDLALRLQPDTQNVAVVTGDSEFERYWLGVTEQEVRLHPAKLKLIDLVGLPTDQLLKRVSELPPHTVVLFQLIPLDSSQPVIGTFDILAAIAQRFPTFCIHNYCLDHGAIGGSYADATEQRVRAGELSARVLAGEPPGSIPVVSGSAARVQVDWRELRRWNIPESALPPGALVLYRQPTIWERYEKYILAGVALIIIQSLMIIGLLWQRARKRKAEATLRESEERFRVMANTTPSQVWMCDKDGKVTYLNDRRIGFTGRDPQAGFGDTWTAFIHPDDLQNVLTANARALKLQKGFSKEYRLRRRDGVYRWMLDFAAPRINGDGKFAGFIGSASDVTDQKLAQEALARMSGRLIEAQEKERSRIARELHDDICQRLALLSLELEQANRGSNGSPVPANARIEEVRQHCSEIASDVQALSHELHSSKLEYLGLAAAVRSFCREFSRQQKVSVDFTDENVPNPLPKDVSLCLFRVAQEALNNAVKYSGVRQFSVDLRGTSDQIQLEVRDAGVGFNLEDAKREGGLGLISMQERVHLVKGVFSVESRVNRGTRILASVPLVAEMKASMAAGSA